MTTIHWFRNDLRTHDHRVLGALPNDVRNLLCIFIVDERCWQQTPLGFAKMGPFRTWFLMQTLTELNRSLELLGNKLVVVAGDSASVLARAINETGAAYVTTDAHITSEELAIDADVRAAIDVPLLRAWSRTLIHPQDLPHRPEHLPNTFTTWRKDVERELVIRPEYPTPVCLSPPPQAYVEARFEIGLLKQWGQHETDERSAFPFGGGEAAALVRLHRFVWTTGALATYKQTRNGLIGTDYSSKFSPWLALGALSPRRIYNEVRRYEHEVESNESTNWLIFELLWRDFFRFTAMKHGTRLFHREGMKGAPTNWQHNKTTFEAWRIGRTGDDFVDANMRELLHTGWMSNRGRQNVASWLTKTKHIDWRWGAAWFEHALIDYDVCSNWGNWAYVSGVGTDPREDRYFNTTKQAEMYDPEGEYRRLWS